VDVAETKARPATILRLKVQTWIGAHFIICFSGIRVERIVAKARRPALKASKAEAHVRAYLSAVGLIHSSVPASARRVAAERVDLSRGRKAFDFSDCASARSRLEQ
jgi:hypothetical protein